MPGRTADDAAYWLAQAPRRGGDAIRVACIGLYILCAAAVRCMLPHATLSGPVLLMQLAVKAITLAQAILRWEDQIVAGVITRVTSAIAESLSRLARLEARLAYGFRNPMNQRHRVRIACARGCRHLRSAAPRRTHSGTGRKPDPG